MLRVIVCRSADEEAHTQQLAESRGGEDEYIPACVEQEKLFWENIYWFYSGFEYELHIT